jgi:hypothetical protein
MANNLSAYSPTYWAKMIAKKRFKTSIFRALASFSESDTLRDGLTVDRPYRADLRVSNYTKGTAVTAQDLTATSDTLTISHQKVILIYIDDVDKVQNKFDLAVVYGGEAGKRIGEIEDAYFLYEVVNAADTIDDGDVGGSAGTAITLTTSNIASVIGKINLKLNANNVSLEEGKRFWAISPNIYDVLWQYIQGKESMLGDRTGENGNIGRYGGLELFITNNLTASAVWTPADNPADEATITINGVVFTFQSVIGTTAGNVLQTTNTETTLTNLAHLINNPTSTTANHNAFTGADLDEVSNWVATSTATALTVYCKGQSVMTVATSEALDLWSKPTQHSLAGVKGAIDMVVQKEPDLGANAMASTISAGKRGMNIMPLCLFGTKTFNQGTKEILDVLIDTSTF